MKSGCLDQPFKSIRKSEINSEKNQCVFMQSNRSTDNQCTQDLPTPQPGWFHLSALQGIFITVTMRWEQHLPLYYTEVPRLLQERQYYGQKQIKSRPKSLKLRNSNNKDTLRSQCWVHENILRNMGKTEKGDSPFQPFSFKKTQTFHIVQDYF